MARDSEEDDLDCVTAKELEQDWLQDQIHGATTEMRLRVAEAVAISGAYSRGELSAEEVNRQIIQYQHRWRDPLCGILTRHCDSDAEIIRRLDEHREKEGRLQGELWRKAHGNAR